MTGATAIDEVLRRVRDAGGAGLPRVEALQILRFAQEHVNAVEDVLRAEIESAFPAGEYRLPFLVSDVAIRRLRSNSKEASSGLWMDIRQRNLRWASTRGESIKEYARAGLDLYIVSPTLEEDGTVELTVTDTPNPPTDDNTELELDAPFLSPVLDLTTMIALLRFRLFPAVQTIAAHLKESTQNIVTRDE